MLHCVKQLIDLQKCLQYFHHITSLYVTRVNVTLFTAIRPSLCPFSRKSVPIFTKICYDFHENLFQSFTKICYDFHENLTGPQHYVQIHPQQTNADSAKRNSFTPTKHSTNFTAPIFIKPKPLDNFFRVFLYLLFLCPPPPHHKEKM